MYELVAWVGLQKYKLYQRDFFFTSFQLWRFINALWSGFQMLAEVGDLEDSDTTRVFAGTNFIRQICFSAVMSWWRHQMETFPHDWPLVRGIHRLPVTGEFPSQRPVTRDLMFSLICAWIIGWVNNREAGDLRRHRAHYDVIVMYVSYLLVLRARRGKGWTLNVIVAPVIMYMW